MVHDEAILQNLTDRGRAGGPPEKTKANLAVALARAHFGNWEVDVAGQQACWSAEMFRLFGRDPASGSPSLEQFLEHVYADDRGMVRRRHADDIAQREGHVIEFRIARADGAVGWIESRSQPVFDAAGNLSGFFGTAQDITERVVQNDRIARLSRFHALLSRINALIVRVRDRRSLFEEACRIAVEHGGFSLAWIGMLDRATGNLVEAGSAAGDSSARPFPRECTPVGPAEIALREKRMAIDGASHSMPGLAAVRSGNAARAGANWVAALPLLIEQKAVGVLCLFGEEPVARDDDEVRLLSDLAGDISFGLDYIEKSERAEYLAFHDSLTGLPNRALLGDRLAQHLHAARRDGRMVALALFDLSRFRMINDSHGRAAGDGLLREIAGRLQAQIRPEDTIARIGPDSFAVALAGVNDVAETVLFLEQRLLPALSQLFQTGTHQLQLSAHCGVAVFPVHGVSVDMLVSNAEAALKEAQAGAERFLFYAPQMNARVSETLALETRLRRALDRQEFVLHYQPKLSLRGHRVTGLEALIRWNDPEVGLVLPARFIPLLEETGLIVEVGRWALAQVAKDCRQWTQQGVPPLRIAVNVSTIQLRRHDFVEQVIGASEDAVRAGGALDLEITESVIMANVETANRKLQILRGLGVGVAVDDFGTGYSSLAYVARLPIQALKIDRSFVAGMMHSAENRAIVHSVVTLAHALKLEVIAEGGETGEQARQLAHLGCDHLQGFLVSRPLAPEDVPPFLLHWNSLGAVMFAAGTHKRS